MTRQESARINGPKSRGPVTPAGKAISSRNALKHGLCALTGLLIPNILLDNESEERYQAHLAAMLAKYQPIDEDEAGDVVTYCGMFWRARRAMELEAAAVNGKLAELNDPGMKQAFRTQLAFSEAYQDCPFFANLALYETRIQRLCEKARRRLDAMLERHCEQGNTTKLAPPTPIRTNEPVAAPQNHPQIARGAQCPCGSGVKYKRCCGGPLAPPLIGPARRAA